MNSFVMIQRKKQTIFTDTEEYNSVHELKKIIAGIIKVPPENQRLFYKDAILKDTNKLSDYGLHASKATSYNPAPIGLVLKVESGQFEPLEITAYSTPIDLIQSMENLETNND